MPKQLKVMISSTARDLPEHRKQIVEACLRQNMFPLRMEDLPANSDQAVTASMKLVDEADIYVGIVAYRYGYIPQANNPTQISVTEMEYNRAIAGRLERIIFVTDKSHPITIDDVDIENADKLESFKNRLLSENIVRFFKSPDDLRAEAINSLSQIRQPDLSAFHYVTDIPGLPKEYIAHPYTLLQTNKLIGRQFELSFLTDWITGKTLKSSGLEVSGNLVRIMNIIAIGGMGKSALTWKWFKDIAPEKINPLAGRLWWSFYESDSSFENFLIRALAYVTRRRISEVEHISLLDRQSQLIMALDQEPFLIVLDGLERLLIAYARMDASRLDGMDFGKEKNLRKTADPRIGSFLKRLTQVKHSRILVSSRLCPTEFETQAADPSPGTFQLKIRGLTDEDAVKLWRAFGVSGTHADLLPVFNTFEKHPLLVQALAGEVKRDRKNPGDFEAWRKANNQFNPHKFPKVKDAMDHVLKYALRGLEDDVRKVLQTISAFRMPARYDTLAALLSGKRKTYTNEIDLDKALTELEDRGLLGWDRRANRYDLHPVVRGQVWNTLNAQEKKGIYRELRPHFRSLLKVDPIVVTSLDDLTSEIEFFNTLIGLHQYGRAYEFWQDNIEYVSDIVLKANRERIALLSEFFPSGLNEIPRIRDRMSQVITINSLATTLLGVGDLQNAITLFKSTLKISEDDNLSYLAADSYSQLSNAFRLQGQLYNAEHSVYKAILLFRDEEGPDYLDRDNLESLLVLTTIRTRPPYEDTIYEELLQRDADAWAFACLSEAALWRGNTEQAKMFAEKSLYYGRIDRYEERDFIRANRLQGIAEFKLHSLLKANEKLHYALTRARRVNLADEELAALLALGELRYKEKDLVGAREFLNEVCEFADRGPYALFHADALNLLADVARDEGNTEMAAQAATKAYQLAWCDGPPFVYLRALKRALQHLTEFGVPQPELPSFDALKFEPMPEVDIDHM